jgi:hypothetical protein
VDNAGGPVPGATPPETAVETLDDLARMLRRLRRRHARRQADAELTYREIAARTGWSHAIVGHYLTGKVLPPTDRFDVLVRLFGASPAEQRALATARDRIEELRRPAGHPSGPPRQLPPRQLPPDVFGFTGRHAELAVLDEIAALDQFAPTAARDAAVVVVAVSGTAGVGKTALAVHWAHRVADRFPDGQLYLDLRGHGPGEPLSAADALATLLRGLPPGFGRRASVPADLAERAAAYRTALAGRRVLLLLDNAADTEQVRWLLPGTASSLVVVTSRSRLSGLVARDGARPIDLDVLGPGDAVHLLRTLVGARVDADPGAAAGVVERCGRLPLALRVAAELAAAEPSATMGGLLADLNSGRCGLDLMDAGGDPRTGLGEVLSWSRGHLPAPAARLFDLLGLHPGRDIAVPAAAALAGVTAADARRLLDELVRASLVHRPRPGRYAMHDLLREYAARTAARHVPPADRAAALTRLLDHYVRAAGEAVQTIYRYERHDGPAGPSADAAERALAWLDEERTTLAAVAAYAAAHGWTRHGAALSDALRRHVSLRGRPAAAR